MEERQGGSEVREICEEVLPRASSVPRIESSVQPSSQLCVVRVTGSGGADIAMWIAARTRHSPFFGPAESLSAITTIDGA